MALAWPLRACHEVGRGDLIDALVSVAKRLSANVRPNSSRAETLMLLINAVLPHGLKPVMPAIASLKSLTGDSHWRIVRAFVDCALLVNEHGRQTAAEVASLIPVENKRAATLARLEDGQTMQPREFFW